MKQLATALSLSLAVTGTAAFSQDNPMTEVSDGVYHFFAMGYSSMVVVGDNGVLVTDPAFPPRAKLLKEAVSGVTDKPVSHVALSHEHYDHIGGTGMFDGADIIMQENGLDVLDLVRLMPKPEVSTTFGDSISIDLGGKTVEMHHLAVGDGVATAITRVVEDDVIYSADLYVPKGFSPSVFKEDTNFVGVGVILDTLVEWAPAYAINAHSNGNSMDALRENAVMMNELEDAVVARFKKAFADGERPVPVLFSISNEIKLPKYADWENYDSAFPAYVRRMALSVFHGG